jgi:hypothetical protein
MTEPRPLCEGSIDDDIGGDPPCWAHLFDAFEEGDSATSAEQTAQPIDEDA